jgi:hypothetical protein
MRIARHASGFLVFLVAFAIAPLRAAAQAPASHPDFTGTWMMDTTKLPKSDASLLALTLDIARRGDTLFVKTEGRDATRGPFTTSSTYGFDGKPWQNAIPGGGAIVAGVLSWERETLVISSSGYAGERLLKIIERWSLDPSAKTLTRRQAAVVGGNERSQTLAFTRQ